MHCFINGDQTKDCGNGACYLDIAFVQRIVTTKCVHGPEHKTKVEFVANEFVAETVEPNNETPTSADISYKQHWQSLFSVSICRSRYCNSEFFEQRILQAFSYLHELRLEPYRATTKALISNRMASSTIAIHLTTSPKTAKYSVKTTIVSNITATTQNIMTSTSSTTTTRIKNQANLHQHHFNVICINLCIIFYKILI